jgi:ABC-type sugar transport system, periplasmic component
LIQSEKNTSAEGESVGKKLSARLVVLVVCIGLISGCAGPAKSAAPVSDVPKAPVEILFWNPFGGGEGDYVGQIIKSFNESQQGTVVRQLRLESNEYYVRLSTALSFGKGPDVAVAHADRVSPFVKAKQIIPLDELAQLAGFDFSHIEEKNRNSVVYDNKPYAVPLDTHFHMLYYNKDLLAEAGLQENEVTSMLSHITPQEFMDFLAQLRDRLPGVQPLAVNTPYFQEPFLDMYYEAGGELLTPDLKHAAINNDKALDVLRFYQELFADGLSDLNDKTPWDTFHNGQAVFWMGGIWEAGHHLGDSSFHSGIMELPSLFGGNEQWGSSHTLIIPTYVTKEKQLAAMSFIRYFSEVGSLTWGEAGHVPANETVQNDMQYQNLPYRKLFLEAAHHVKLAPNTDKYAALYTVLSEELQNIIANRLDPVKGLDNLEQKLNELLAS